MRSDASADIHARLLQLERFEAARAAVIAYATAVDSADPVAVADVFSSNATLTIPKRALVGRDEILRFFGDRLSGSEKRHFLANTTITPSARGVRAESYYFFTSREQGASGIGWGRYSDEIAFDGDGRAMIVAKTITPAIASDLARGWPL